MRAAFAVGSANPGFPFDVLALFTSQREALRHADGAAYVFEVFALPVYEDQHELPPWLRHRGGLKCVGASGQGMR